MAEQPAAPPSKSILLTPFALPMLLLLATIFNDVEGRLYGLFWLAGTLFSLLLCIDYVRQLSYIKNRLGRSVKGQKVLVWSALIVPTLGAIVGDFHGVTVFGSDAASGALTVGLIGSLMAAIAVINVLAIVNVPVILTKGRHNALDAVSFVVQALLWLAVFAIAYFIYGLMYSLRDPNTE